MSQNYLKKLKVLLLFYRVITKRVLLISRDEPKFNLIKKIQEKIKMIDDEQIQKLHFKSQRSNEV